MAMLGKRAADTAERIMQSIEDRCCIIKEDLVREILATLEDVEADFWSVTDPLPENVHEYRPRHYFRVAAHMNDTGHREQGDKAMKKGFEIMLLEGRLTWEEFRALMLQRNAYNI